MRLTPPAWRTAWYEEGLSERFAQEMSRLEKSALQDLDTSAEWVEQLVIELGQLTQNMIHLEGELPRPNQLKLAFERALKLAALSAHLMAALDQAIDHGPAVLRYSERGSDRSPPPPVPPRLNPTPSAQVQAGVPDPRSGQDSAALAALQSPTSPGHSLPQQSIPANAPGMRASTHAQVGVMRQAQAGTRPAPAAAEPRQSAMPQPLVSNLMEMSEPMIEGSPSPMREMILALSRRGLSRSEIEVITEQPRHIIEAVLQHGG
jgi:hypothetical protein